MSELAGQQDYDRAELGLSHDAAHRTSKFFRKLPLGITLVCSWRNIAIPLTSQRSKKVTEGTGD